MSVAVCRSSVASGFESILALPTAFSASSNWLCSSPVAPKNPQTQTEAERSPGEVDIWASIQAQKAQQEPVKKEEPYVHPLMRRSSSLLSQKSLEVCTENLSSEPDSDDYFSFSDGESNFFTSNKQTALEEEEELAHKEKRMRSNYRCCSMSRASELRRFPPPLPSISRRDGPCLKMLPLRRDGRLVVEAVTVPSQNYLQAQRHNGRLLLSFINTTTNTTSHNSSFDDAIERNNASAGIINEEEEEAQDDTEEEEEEEVQVVDRGTVVEVNVSTKPPQQDKKKVHRSSIVINKFVSFTPTINNEDNYTTPAAAAAAARPTVRRSSTTAAAAAVAASSLSASSAGDVADPPATAENKLMLTCRRRRNREDLLLDMRRCGQLRRPLFFWETCCIATSS